MKKLGRLLSAMVYQNIAVIIVVGIIQGMLGFMGGGTMIEFCSY